jgi:two-component system LytT family sensor kinase
VVRFGREKLRVIKELDPATLELLVPSMVLQPLVENAIKHGLGPRLDGGTITLRSRLAEGKLVIQVEDDGVGMAEAGSQPAVDSVSTGIGMANVAERLTVLYGDAAKMSSGSREGDGTRITLELPLVETEAGAKSESAAAVLYEARSSTQR